MFLHIHRQKILQLIAYSRAIPVNHEFATSIQGVSVHVPMPRNLVFPRTGLTGFTCKGSCRCGLFTDSTDYSLVWPLHAVVMQIHIKNIEE